MSNVIHSTLSQVEQTTISIGHSHGHFISSAQVAVIRRALATDKSTADFAAFSISPPTPVALDPVADLQDQLRLVRSTIESRKLALHTADKSEKPRLNLSLNEAVSEAARIEGILKKLRA